MISLDSQHSPLEYVCILSPSCPVNGKEGLTGQRRELGGSRCGQWYRHSGAGIRRDSRLMGPRTVQRGWKERDVWARGVRRDWRRRQVRLHCHLDYWLDPPAEDSSALSSMELWPSLPPCIEERQMPSDPSPLESVPFTYENTSESSGELMEEAIPEKTGPRDRDISISFCVSVVQVKGV